MAPMVGYGGIDFGRALGASPLVRLVA